nr:tetratricopeptide repeat protein [Escherichia coli]
MRYGSNACRAAWHNPDTLEGVYAYAYNFYEKGRLDEAELFFKFLCIYDFQNYNYLKGYAAVCQLKKDYQKAFDMYHICLMLSPITISLWFIIWSMPDGLKKH